MIAQAKKQFCRKKISLKSVSALKISNFVGNYGYTIEIKPALAVKASGGAKNWLQDETNLTLWLFQAV